MRPKLTVVMPTYNQDKFIREAIDSILGQTIQNFELIVVNDGSTDGTAGILSSYHDPRLRVIDREALGHQGPGLALNVGFSAGMGDYETWLASDNVAYPQAYETLCRYLDEHPMIDYVYGNCHLGKWHPKTGEWPLHDIRREILSQEYRTNRSVDEYYFGIMWVWRRWARLASGPYIEGPCEDYDMVLHMEEAGAKFAFLDECLGKHRRHEETLSFKTPHSVHHVIQRAAKNRRGMYR